MKQAIATPGNPADFPADLITIEKKTGAKSATHPGMVTFDLGGHMICSLEVEHPERIASDPTATAVGILLALRDNHTDGQIHGGYEGTNVNLANLDVIYIHNPESASQILATVTHADILAFTADESNFSGGLIDAGPFGLVTMPDSSEMKATFSNIFDREEVLRQQMARLSQFAHAAAAVMITAAHNTAEAVEEVAHQVEEALQHPVGSARHAFAQVREALGLTPEEAMAATAQMEAIPDAWAPIPGYDGPVNDGFGG